MRSFGDILTEILAERQLTIKEAADQCGIHYTMLYGYISEKATGKRPSIENILKIAKGLRVTPNRLLDFPEGILPDPYIIDAAAKLASLPPDHPTRKAIETLLGLDPSSHTDEKPEEGKKD